MRGINPQKKFAGLMSSGTITTPWNGSTTQEPGGTHKGIDIAAQEGTPLRAPISGIVTKVDNSHSGVDNSYGNTVEVKDPKTAMTLQFHHLKDIAVKPGQQVQEGQPIMSLGATGAVYSKSGNSPANLDVRLVDAYKRYRNPAPYINKL
jgi:murein DD-endopeptidase MepM/ murein hydrolase activator NlpD